MIKGYPFVPNYNPLKIITSVYSHNHKDNDNDNADEQLKLKLKQRKYSDKNDNNIRSIYYNNNNSSKRDLTNSIKSRNSSALDLDKNKKKKIYKDCSIQLRTKRFTPYQLYKIKSAENKDSLQKKSEMNSSASFSKIIFNTKLTDSLLQKKTNKINESSTGVNYSNIIDLSNQKQLAMPIYLKKKIKHRIKRDVYQCLSVVPIKKYSIVKRNAANKLYSFDKKRGPILPMIFKKKCGQFQL